MESLGFWWRRVPKAKVFQWGPVFLLGNHMGNDLVARRPERRRELREFH